MIKELYLNQLTYSLENTIELTASQINRTYIDLLESGITTKSTRNYFNSFTRNPNYSIIYSEVFIFNNNLNLISHSDSNRSIEVSEPRLFLYKKEIFDLGISNSVTSLPFKGNDNNWYLWGFYKLSPNHWLAVKESANNFEKVEQLSGIIWYFGIGGILISILFGIIVSSSITKPIRKLVSFSDEIGKGKLNVKIPENMKGELQILASAMDQMKNNISNNQKEKEKILAQIAHEIRNPLGGIELLTNLISEEENSNKKQKEYTQRILNEIGELKKLISSYLDYSKPSALSMEMVDLENIIEECEILLNNELSEKGIKLERDIKLDKIHFDKSHLKKILINLIKNSIESITDNGEIIIQANINKNKSCISVSDNGKGIAESELQNIFNPFYTTKSDGTGLGLASCKKYCEDNYAELIVERLNNGTKFMICKEERAAKI